MPELNDRKIAILATDGFEEVELAEPRKVLEQAGAQTFLISPKEKSVSAWDHVKWSGEYDVDVPLDQADPADYDGLFLPGGVLNPDSLRTEEKAIQFANHFWDEGKPIAAICHGPQLLIETGRLEGKTMTSYHSVKTDIINAGANWVNEEVVVDNGFVTSRNPDDIPAFCDKMIEEFREGVHREMAQK